MQPTNEMITDKKVIGEAIILRERLTLKIIRDWDKISYRHGHLEEKLHTARQWLAEELNCYDPDLSFYSSVGPINKKLGIEPHVLDGLRKLAGPNGHTYFKVLKLRREDRLNEQNRKKFPIWDGR